MLARVTVPFVCPVSSVYDLKAGANYESLHRSVKPRSRAHHALRFPENFSGCRGAFPGNFTIADVPNSKPTPTDVLNMSVGMCVPPVVGVRTDHCGVVSQRAQGFAQGAWSSFSQRKLPLRER